MGRILRTRKQLKIWKILLGANVKKIMVTNILQRHIFRIRIGKEGET
jgi:hypothetical protein